MPQYRRITIAVGLAMLVDASLYLAVLPLLPYYADRFDLGTFGLALILASFPISAPVVSLTCIGLAPRVGARRIALVSAVLMTASTVLFAFAPTAAVLIVARFLQGMASATVWTAQMAWVTHNAPEERRGREAGIVMGLFSIGSVAGPGVGALAAWTGPTTAFLGVAVVSLASLVTVWAAPAGAPVPPGEPLLPSLRAVVRSPLARAAIAMSVIDPLAFTAMDLLVPVNLADDGISTTAIAVLFSVAALLGALAGPVGGRLVDRHGAPRVGLVAGLAIALIPVILALGPPLIVQVAALVAAFPLFAAGTAAMYPLAALGADAAGVAHGAANGLLGTFWAATSTFAALLAGGVADRAGEQAAYAVAFALALPFIALLTLGVRRGSRTPATPSP